MFRSRRREPSDDTALTPPTRGLNNSGGTGVNRGANQSNLAGSLPSSPISATTVDRADSPSLEVIPPHSERVALAIRQSMEGGSTVTIDDATEDELALVRYLADELYEPDFVVAAGVDGATGKGWAIVANATTLNPDEGSAAGLPAICSASNGGATGAAAEPAFSNTPEGLAVNRPPVRYGAPAAAVLRAQTAAPSHYSASVASVRSAMLPGNARDVLNPAGDRGGTKSDSASVAPLAVRHQPPEPCDREVSRSARRLNLLGSCAVAPRASRLPGSARPTVDGTRPADVDDVSLSSLLGCALVGVVTFILLFVW